jgi:hypothetical protein
MELTDLDMDLVEAGVAQLPEQAVEGMAEMELLELLLLQPTSKQ